MREDGSYSKEEFVERKNEIDNEIAITRISLSEARIDQYDMGALLGYTRRYITDLGRQWQDMPIEFLPRFQKLVFPSGISYRKEAGFGTAPLGLIFEVNRDFQTQESDAVDPIGFEPMTSALQMRRSTN